MFKRKKKVRLKGEKMLLYDVWTITRGLFVVHRNAHKENLAVSKITHEVIY